MRRHGQTLRRRYGHEYGYREAGARAITEMLSEQEAPTVRAPRMTMRQQIDSDRMLKAVREAERVRR